jgi:hypothetical protein
MLFPWKLDHSGKETRAVSGLASPTFAVGVTQWDPPLTDAHHSRVYKAFLAH